MGRQAPLALLGGTPRFSDPLHVGRPNIGDRAAFLARVEGALDRRWLTNDGQLVLELESRLRDYLGVRHCVTMSSGTHALAIAIRALGLSGEVIVPAFTFIATAHVLEWHGITPVFCDIDARTHQLDLASVEALIGPRTSAVLGVHLWGEPCDVDGLETLTRRHGLRLVFDAAHAFGAGHGGRKIGGFGNAEAFSFHATKVFNTLEGGALATNDDDLAAVARRMRNFGFGPSDVPAGPGINAKMNEISAAMGLTNLESLDGFIDRNRLNYEAYRRGMDGIPGIRLLVHGRQDRNHHYVVVEVDPGEGRPTRDEIMAVMHAENVLVRRYYWPGCHRAEPYRSRPGGDACFLPVTDAVAARVLALPNGTAVMEANIADVCDIVRVAMTRPDLAGMIRQKLDSHDSTAARAEVAERRLRRIRVGRLVTAPVGGLVGAWRARRAAVLRILTMGISVALLYMLYRSIDARRVATALAGVDPGWLVLAIGLLVPITVLRAMRFRWLLPQALPHLWEAVRLLLVASAFNMFLPAKTGDFSKSVVIARRGGATAGMATAAVVYERLADLTGLIAWALLGRLATHTTSVLPRSVWAIVALVGIGAAVVILSVTAARIAGGVLTALLPGKRLSRLREIVLGWPDLLVSIGPRRWLLAAFSFGLWFVQLTQIWLLTVAVGVPISFPVCIGLAAIALMVAQLPLSFNGIGIRDVAIVFLLAPFTSPDKAAAVGLLTSTRVLLPPLVAIPLLRSYMSEVMKARVAS